MTTATDAPPSSRIKVRGLKGNLRSLVTLVAMGGLVGCGVAVFETTN